MVFFFPLEIKTKDEGVVSISLICGCIDEEERVRSKQISREGIIVYNTEKIRC
jgi:hypothetical protein